MTIVQTSFGALQGHDAGAHQCYLGIPFAAPPAGPGRFCPPGPPAAWTGTRDATRHGASCPQGRHPIPGMAASGPRAEDCLFLNVFTPAADAARRPVLVWIHGGGFRLGSGSEALYHGGPLAQRGDLVVVTIHYRLAALGYGCFGEASLAWGASANCGQLDQLAALRWVRSEIAAFGGDPDNVSVFGESAGSAAIGTLLAMPASRGLFHKAIMQSGTGRATTFERASRLGDELLNALGARADDPASVQALDVDAIVEAANRLAPDMMSGLMPAIDGRTLFEQPMAANAAGASAEIPLLIGTNRDEMKLFNVTPDRAVPGHAELLALTAESLGGNVEGARGVIEALRRSRIARGLPTRNDDLLDSVQTIARFRLPTDRFAIDHARHQPRTYHYLFSYESPARRGAFGACHALEMPFVFGTLDAPTQDRFAGSGPVVEKLSAQMMDAWIAFARDGDPSHPGIGDWPGYDADTRPTMIFDRACRLETDPLAAERLAVAAALNDSGG